MKVMLSVSSESGHKHEGGADPTVMIWQVILRMIRILVHSDSNLHKQWRKEAETKFLPMLINYVSHLTESRDKKRTKEILERFVKDGALLVPRGIKAAFRDANFSDTKKIAEQEVVESKHSLHSRIIQYAPDFVEHLMNESMGPKEKASLIEQELYDLVRKEISNLKS